MVQNLTVGVKQPIPTRQIKLPKGVNDRLQKLLDRQDRGKRLTDEERTEAEGLAELAEMLTLFKLERERDNIEENALDESANLYAQVYSNDEDLKVLTESALLETVHD